MDLSPIEWIKVKKKNSVLVEKMGKLEVPNKVKMKQKLTAGILNYT